MLVEAGSAIHRAVNAQLEIAHPEIEAIKGISYTMFNSVNADGELKGATIMPPGRIDRSPCGTGNSARLAVDQRSQLELAGLPSSITAPIFRHYGRKWMPSPAKALRAR